MTDALNISNFVRVSQRKYLPAKTRMLGKRLNYCLLTQHDGYGRLLRLGRRTVRLGC
ncbi:MAG: hypothetical protein QOJ64_1764 [Acidobacteriota bacterium]|nr:hypothetical protein [Acidobacteriota bacterium]